MLQDIALLSGSAEKHSQNGQCTLCLTCCKRCAIPIRVFVLRQFSDLQISAFKHVCNTDCDFIWSFTCGAGVIAQCLMHSPVCFKSARAATSVSTQRCVYKFRVLSISSTSSPYPLCPLIKLALCCRALYGQGASLTAGYKIMSHQQRPDPGAAQGASQAISHLMLSTPPGMHTSSHLHATHK